MTMTTDNESTTAEPIVIFPAVTCPADFPARCAALSENIYKLYSNELCELLVETLGLNRQFELVLATTTMSLEGEDFARLLEETGWGAIHGILSLLSKDIAYALGDTYVDGYVPAWDPAGDTERTNGGES